MFDRTHCRVGLAHIKDIDPASAMVARFLYFVQSWDNLNRLAHSRADGERGRMGLIIGVWAEVVVTS